MNSRHPVFLLALLIVCVSILGTNECLAQWHSRYDDMPGEEKFDWTIPLVILGVATLATIVIIVANQSPNPHSSDSTKASSQEFDRRGLNPCLDSLFVLISQRPWNSLTNSERDYMFRKGKECEVYESAMSDSVQAIYQQGK